MIYGKMTSDLTTDDRNAERMEPKSENEKITIDPTGARVVRDETRSFLNFSPENLSISHSELEQGFNKPSRCFRVRRQTLLSVIAILVALVCASIEIWKLHRVLTNGREIELLKRDVEKLKHRLFSEDFMDELNAFEEQLYADGTETEEDSGETDIEGADYDNNYDENYGTSWSDYAGNSRESTVASPFTSSSSVTELQSFEKKSALKSTSSSSVRDRELVEMLAVLRKVEANRGEEFDKIVHDNHKNIAKARTAEGNRDLSHERGNERRRTDPEHEKTEDDHQKHRRAVTEEIPIGYTIGGLPIFAVPRMPDDRNRTEQGILDDLPVTDRSEIVTTEVTWDRHPPKKYFAVTQSEDWHTLPSHRRSSALHGLNSRFNGLRRLHQDPEVSRRSVPPRGMAKRHLRAPRQVFAAHYGADSSLFGMDDEHTGNGRAKHNQGIFKAWQPSNWVSDLGMSRHFALSQDGRLTVHEPGLYLVYGQIHYLDEHDENGFHLLVNAQPILQCMVYSPGTGHKSRSCFSAQVTLLQSGDRLVLKDVGPARYTLFQHDKSFFGLIKLGDTRQQQPRHTTQSPRPER